MAQKSFDGFLLRTSNGVIERRDDGGTWAPTAKTVLRDEFSADSDVWTWLKDQGIKRPSPSGTVRSDKEYAARGYERIGLRIQTEVMAKLDKLVALAGRTSRTDAIVHAIEEAFDRATRKR
jgi:hypothetical protein